MRSIIHAVANCSVIGDNNGDTCQRHSVYV